MKEMIVVALLSFSASLILGKLALPFLTKLKAGQPILKYVESHKEKNGTPTMGGLFFIISAVSIFYIFGGGKSRVSNVSIAIGLSFMVVGFIDDFIKVHYKKNEGLKAYQKIIFQFSIAVLAGVFAFDNGITAFYLPFSKSKIDIGFFTIPVVALVFIAITNSVNLTDGLDGLASSVSGAYLFILIVLISLQNQSSFGTQNDLIGLKELNDLSACLIGALLGFLCYNVSKAKIFMGDTGSLSLGGFIGAISIFSFNTFFIPIIGIMFVLSSISVIMQVLYFKKTRKRIFLMAPLHHHFQLKGVSEAKISFYYSLVTLISGGVILLAYL